MNDLYEKRRKEFIWYHINGDGDCNGQVLRVYAQVNCLNDQDCFDLAYFYATTYCCASAIFLLSNRQQIHYDCRAFADKYKEKLVFQSDRKYVRMRDNFYKMLRTWEKSLYKASDSFRNKTHVSERTISTKKALEEAEKWYFFKRFSAYLFVETYCDILGIDGTRETGMIYEGDSMTFAGGLFYVYGMDNEAKFVQKHHRLPVDNVTFEYLIEDLQNEIKQSGGDDNLTKLETSLCAYEKFFKGSRYNGYYADRQLSELNKMKQDVEFFKSCKEVFAARENAVASSYRGEDNGWDGIRAQLKKSYLKTGEIIGHCR